jgi:hypothetical protein
MRGRQASPWRLPTMAGRGNPSASPAARLVRFSGVGGRTHSAWALGGRFAPEAAHPEPHARPAQAPPFIEAEGS